MEETTGQLISNNNPSNSELDGNEPSKQINTTNAIGGFVDGINEGVNIIDGINKKLIDLIGLMDLVS